MPIKNKEERKAYMKKYYQANREKRVAQSRTLRQSKKDGLYTVYYLKEEHYAGMTLMLGDRLRRHKFNGKHIQDVEIVGKYKTKAEATRVEASLHAMGYLGRHPRDKQQTLKELI